MYIENYTAKIVNNCKKPYKFISISANTVQEAHKKALFSTNYLTEEIAEIVDSNKEVVYTLKDGFKD